MLLTANLLLILEDQVDLHYEEKLKILWREPALPPKNSLHLES